MKHAILPLLITCGLVGALIYSQERSGPFTVSGFVESDEVRVGSRIGGRVTKVLVEEGRPVHSGEVLVELDPFDLQERLAESQFALAQTTAAYDRMAAGFRPEEIAQAAARRDQAKAELLKLSNGPRPQEIAAAEAELEQAQASLQLATQDYQRVEALFGRQAADQSDLDEASTKLSVARATSDARQEQLELLKAGSRAEDIAAAQAQLEEAEQEVRLRQNGYRKEEIREAAARRDAADATVKAIQQQIRELQITSPVDAVVEAIDLRPGDLVAANAPSVSLAETGRLWVRAYVPENHLDLQLGQTVTIRVDSFPNRDFQGKIVFIARQAEFTPGNIQTPEERSKQVFRIKVLLQPEETEVLRPGMSADVILDREGQ
jgi:multidrug resistance efflux pump